MKATGIVRRIDDLGRVVIPKEIRRTMRLQEGDPLEIYINEGAVCFKKYDTGKYLIEDFMVFKKNLEENIYDISVPVDKRTKIFDAADILLKLLKED